MAEGDDEIKLRLALETQEAVTKAQEFTELVRKLQVEVQKVAAAAKSSFAVAATSLAATAKEKVPQRAAELYEGKQVPSYEAGYKIAAQEAKVYADAAKQAAKELEATEKGVQASITANRKQATSESIQLSKQSGAQYKAEAQSRLQQEQAVIKGIEDNEKKTATVISGIKKKEAEDSIKASKESAKGWHDEAVQRLKDQKELASQAAAQAFKPTMAAAGALPGAQQTKQQVEEMKTAIQSVATQANVSFKVAGAAILEYAQKVGITGNQLKQLKANINAATTELGKQKMSFDQLGTALSKLGIIIGLAQIIRSIVGYLREAAQAGYEFAKAMYQVSIGVHAMQRSGINITIRDVLENIQKLRREFGIFSEKELVEGTAQLVNLTRDFGFAKNQVFEMQEAIATLAVVNGRAMDEVQRTVALALSSGYTEGLQRLGVSINRVTIAEKAASLGYADSYMALTELQRAEATRILILEKTAKYQKDLLTYQETAPGKIDKARAAWADLGKEIGTTLLPALSVIIPALVDAAVGLWNITKVAILGIQSAFASLAATLVFVTDLAKQAWAAISGKEFKVDVNSAFLHAQKVFRDISKMLADQTFNVQIGVDVDVDVKKTTKFTEDQLNAYKSLFEDLTDLDKEYGDKRAQIEQDYNDDILKINEEHVAKLTEIWDNYYQDVIKINEDAASDIADANEKLAQDIEDLNRDTQTKVADENRKYHENELKAERDYQEKLRRLREEFLFDLEDALRERDALQVLRLIRRYNLDKAQAARQEDQDKKERADSHRQQLEEIRRDAQERLAELQRENARRIAEIQEQTQKELAEAKKSAEQAAAQENADYAKQMAERQKQHAKDLEELKKWLQERIDEMIEKFTKTEGVTAEMSKKVAQVIKAVFSNSGLASQYFKEFGKMIDAAVAKAQTKVTEMENLLKQVQSMASQINSTSTNTSSSTSSIPNPPTGYVGGWTPQQVGGHASGATNMILTRPQRILAGEVPERVDITPLNQVSNKNGNGKGALEITLGSGLEGRIIDNTLYQFDIILKKELSKK